MNVQSMDKKQRFYLFVLVRTLANTLIMTGLILTFMAIYPMVSVQVSYYWDDFWGQKRVIEDDVIKVEEAQQSKIASGFAGVLAEPAPIPITPVDTNFGIVIEKINVNAPVIANVESSDYDAYMAALAKGAVHANGTAYPGSREGDNNNVFIFAHSTLNPWDVARYNAIFILLNKLESGDKVVTFYKGKRYDYQVFDKKIVEAHDVQYLTEPSKEPILTLQTCDPPGTQLRRLIVTAKLVGASK